MRQKNSSEKKFPQDKRGERLSNPPGSARKKERVLEGSGSKTGHHGRAFGKAREKKEKKKKGGSWSQ